MRLSVRMREGAFLCVAMRAHSRRGYPVIEYAVLPRAKYFARLGVQSLLVLGS